MWFVSHKLDEEWLEGRNEEYDDMRQHNGNCIYKWVEGCDSGDHPETEGEDFFVKSRGKCTMELCPHKTGFEWFHDGPLDPGEWIVEGKVISYDCPHRNNHASGQCNSTYHQHYTQNILYNHYGECKEELCPHKLNVESEEINEL